MYQMELVCANLIWSDLVFALYGPLWAQGQLSEEASLRTLTEKYFAAYQKKDIEGVMALWSEKAADLVASKKMLEQTFAAHEKIEVKGLAVHKITVDGEKASVGVKIETTAETKSGKATAGLGKMNRTLHFIRESGGWKVWREVGSEEELAGALLAAKSDEERGVLLESEKELVTVELVRALITKGRELITKGSYSRAIQTNTLAHDIAEQIGDKAGIAYFGEDEQSFRTA